MRWGGEWGPGSGRGGRGWGLFGRGSLHSPPPPPPTQPIHVLRLENSDFHCLCFYDDELMLNVLRCHLTYQGQVVTNAEARFNKIHIRKVYACLAVTCHLHFWQNDRDFLRATAVTRGWNGYRNKSQHRKSTLEKKILPLFQQGFEPATFQSRVRCSNH